jgi:hypothetical protein
MDEFLPIGGTHLWLCEAKAIRLAPLGEASSDSIYNIYRTYRTYNCFLYPAHPVDPVISGGSRKTKPYPLRLETCIPTEFRRMHEFNFKEHKNLAGSKSR